MSEYSFWVKLDVDIWFFRPLPMNMVGYLVKNRLIFGHTGYANNGAGCSKELHHTMVSILHEVMSVNGRSKKEEEGHDDYTRLLRTAPHIRELNRCGSQYSSTITQQQDQHQVVSKNSSWWIQDDHVYYSNFVMSSTAFHQSRAHLNLAYLLNEYPSGFFRWRWTDQSLFHKMFGVFVGPREEDFGSDWSFLRWKKLEMKPHAVFYHSKGFKKGTLLTRYTSFC